MLNNKCSQKLGQQAVCTRVIHHDDNHYDSLTGLSWHYKGSEIDPFEKTQVDYSGLDALAAEFLVTAKANGFHASEIPDPDKNMNAMIEEIEELREALKSPDCSCDKAEKMRDKLGEVLTAREEEHADTIIQALKAALVFGVKDIARIVRIKNEFNKTRGWLHGKTVAKI